MCSSNAGAQEQKETEDEAHQFTTQICGKTSLTPSYFLFVKFSFPVVRLMPFYAETSCSHPLIRITLIWFCFQRSTSI